MSGKPEGGRTWRQFKYNRSGEGQRGERDYNPTVTTTPTTTLNKSNKKKN
jgi:hypothetical protein